MHELGLVFEIIKTVDDVKNEQGLSEISQINLEIGEMTDIVPKFIEEAWHSARLGTPYESTKMSLNIITARAKCNDCGAVNEVRSIDFVCPECKSESLSLISGREFNIKSIVAK